MYKLIIVFLCLCSISFAQNMFEKDTISTKDGNLIITFIGHGSLLFEFNGKIIHVDPFSKLADYSTVPDADIILITHHHSDHLDTSAISKINTEKTVVILTEAAKNAIGDKKNYNVLMNGDSKNVSGIEIEAVPAYNLVHKRDDGEPYHPKGIGNGYIITFGDKRVYIAGDTENIPEMKDFKNIDIAFLPMNLPYTMTPEMVVKTAMVIKPAILYPYHYGDTNLDEFKQLMKDHKDIDVRIRKMK